MTDILYYYYEIDNIILEKEINSLGVKCVRLRNWRQACTLKCKTCKTTHSLFLKYQPIIQLLHDPLTPLTFHTPNSTNERKTP